MTRREDGLAALIAEATPGPWAWNGESVVEEFYGRSWEIIQGERGEITIFGCSDADAALIVASTNALPAALAIIRAAREHAELMTAESREYLRSAIDVWDEEGTT